MSTLTSDQGFQVGEIAILVIASFHPERLGEEVEIIEPLAIRTSAQGITGLKYRIRFRDGVTMQSFPKCLRKKRPPREDLQLIRWDQCPWQPEKVHG